MLVPWKKNQNDSAEALKKAKIGNVLVQEASNFRMSENVVDKVGQELATMVNSQ